jgi:hypothetical protein
MGTPGPPPSGVKDLHGHEANDPNPSRARPDKSKNDWKEVEKYIDFFYNWADLGNSYALLDEKYKHVPDRIPP